MATAAFVGRSGGPASLAEVWIAFLAVIVLAHQFQRRENEEGNRAARRKIIVEAVVTRGCKLFNLLRWALARSGAALPETTAIWGSSPSRTGRTEASGFVARRVGPHLRVGSERRIEDG
jgi:hypothetical protein